MRDFILGNATSSYSSRSYLGEIFVCIQIKKKKRILPAVVILQVGKKQISKSHISFYRKILFVVGLNFYLSKEWLLLKGKLCVFRYTDVLYF